MMSMVERVARAIYREFENRPLYAQVQMNVVIAEECARAAIEAMREPTDAMVNSVFDICSPADEEGLYRRMIDAALNEQVAG